MYCSKSLPIYLLLHPQRLADRCMQPIARWPHEDEDNHEYSSKEIINILKIVRGFVCVHDCFCRGGHLKNDLVGDVIFSR